MNAMPDSATRRSAMTDADLKAAVLSAAQDSIGWRDSKLSSERARGLDLYYGRPFGNEMEGRSQVVSTDVADVVEWILPSLLRIFAGGSEVVRFEPTGPEDEEMAAQASDYVNHIFNVDNPGFQILHAWFKDALLQKNGVVKVWWDESREVNVERYARLAEPELVMLLADPDVEPVDHADHGDGFADITVRRRRPGGRVRVTPVPTEEFLISRDARDLDSARFVGHRVLRTASDLIDEGMAPSGVNDAARGMMGAIKRFWDRVNGTKVTGGTADAQTVTYDVAPPGYVAGERLLVRPSLTTTTATPSINVNGLGAKMLKDSTGAALVFGAALAAGTQAELMYDGTDMRIMSLPWKTGSWQPALTPSSGTINYAVRDGYYARFGPMVWVEGVVTCSSVSGLGGSSLKIVGLPYAAATTTYGISCTAGGFNYGVYPNVGTSIVAQISAGTTDIIIQIIETNGTVSIFGPGMQNSTSIQFQAYYFTGAAF